MAYNYSKLLGRITEKFGTQAKFSAAMGLSERSISLKLNGRVNWTQTDIEKACCVLDVPAKEIPAYFFALVVQ